MAPRKYQLIDPASYRRVPWKNGGGVTMDIAGEYRAGAPPGGWDGIIWRLSRTRIETAGPFSDLPGYERLLAVIDGSGLMLHPRNRAAIDVRAPFQAVRFAGEWPIESELLAGPVGVLNLLADRREIDIDLSFVIGPGRLALSATRSIVLALSPASILLDGDLVALDSDGALDFAGAAELMVNSGTIAVAALTPVSAAR
jgi:environmental stress-induced protein Ves